ncbi:MAG: glycosyltransferase, partial [Acidimicrobiia bacterium]|nr:glycosyltransferase [Acidimicrobiia bacterium]
GVVVVPLEGGAEYGAGLSAMCEAQAVGRPVVATRTPGLVDRLDAAATVAVTPRDADELAGAISDLLIDERRARALGRAGRARVERDGTNAHLVDRLEAVVETMR